MKNKILLFIFFLCSLVYGAQVNLALGYTTTWAAAKTACVAGDTLNLGGPSTPSDSAFDVSAAFTWDDGDVVIRSYPGTRQRINCFITGSATTMVLGAHRIHFKNINFEYPTGTASGFNLMVTAISNSNRWEGHTFDSCNFINRNAMSTNLRGLSFIIGSTGQGVTFNDCMWYNIYNGILGGTKTTKAPVTCNRCLFYQSNAVIGHNWTFNYTSFIGPSNQNDVSDSCDNIVFNYCYFNQRSGSGEFVSFAELGNVYYSLNVRVIGCVFDTNTHVHAMGRQNGLIIDSTIFKRNSGTNGTAYYIHNVTASNKNIIIRNSVLANCGSGSTIDGTNVATTPITNFVIIRCVVLGSGALAISSGGSNNTIDSTWFQRTPTITNFTASDTLWNNGHDAYIDTGYHPFVNWYDDRPYVAGIGKIAGITSVDTSDTGFTIELSVSTMLRHPNRPDTNSWMDSRIITGDSARFILKTSMDSVTWVPKDTIVLLASGSGALATTDLNRGTGYKYKVFVEGVSTSLYDTSASYNITTEGTTGIGGLIVRIINKIATHIGVSPF